MTDVAPTNYVSFIRRQNKWLAELVEKRQFARLDRVGRGQWLRRKAKKAKQRTARRKAKRKLRRQKINATAKEGAVA